MVRVSRSQSSVTASILMAGIVILLGTVGAVYLSGFSTYLSESSSAGVSVEEKAGGNQQIKLIDKGDSEKVIVRGDDGTRRVLDSPGDSVTVPSNASRYSVVGVNENGKEELITSIDVPNVTATSTVVTFTPTATPTPTPTATPTPTKDVLWSDSFGVHRPAQEVFKVSNDSIYVYGSREIAYQLSDGSVKYNKSSPVEHQRGDLAGGTLYTTGFNNTSHMHIQSTDAVTGNMLYTTLADSAGLQSGALEHAPDGKLYVAITQNLFEADSSDGSVTWDGGKGHDNDAYTSMSYSRDDYVSLSVFENASPVLFVNNGASTKALAQSKKPNENREEWSKDSAHSLGGSQISFKLVQHNGLLWEGGTQQVKAFNLNESTVEKTYDYGAHNFNMKDDIFYALDNDVGGSPTGEANMTAIDTSTDSYLWEHNFSSLGDIGSTPAYAGGTLYTVIYDESSDTSVVYAVDASTGDRKWVSKELPGETFHKPVVANGIVVAEVGNTIYTFDADHNQDSSSGLCDNDGGCGSS